MKPQIYALLWVLLTIRAKGTRRIDLAKKFFPTHPPPPPICSELVGWDSNMGGTLIVGVIEKARNM